MTPDRWARIEEILHAALERPADQRNAFLDEACRGDQPLRRNVELLLAGDAEPSLQSPLQSFLRSGKLELAPADVLAQYLVEAKIGEGGMGAVYRAYDPRLKRKVALKILPPEHFADPERRRRLMCEARAASALNHPNIVTIYEVGSDDEVDFIAMEYIEGNRLDELIPAKGLRPAQVFGHAVQIADALAKAHGAGILHRDIKPSNVMVTADGYVKVLDFGLAKILEQTETSPDTALVTEKTEEGVVLGTATYMSPEQAEGRKLDARSDIFSFGSMLYEMATGRRPFAGESRVAVLNRIVNNDPQPPGQIAPLSPDFEKLILRCLRKDPARRYQTMADLKVALEALEIEASGSRAQGAVSTFTRLEEPVPIRRLAAIASLIAAVAGIAWVAAGWGSRPGVAGAAQLRFTPMEVARYPRYDVKWSPDGRAFAYAALVSGKYQVFLRYLNSPEPRQLTHESDNVHSVGWTPDGKRVIVYGSRKFSSVLAIGGDLELLAKEDRPLMETNIAPDGKGYAAIVHAGGKYFIETAPSVGSPATRYPSIETADAQNSPNLGISPDHRRLLYFEDVPGARLAWDLPLPVGRTAPRRVLPDLANFGGTPSFSWLPDSRHIVLAFQAKHDDAHNHLWLADVDSGRRRQLTGGISSEFAPAVSPDGSKVLFTQDRSEYSLVSVALDTAAADRVITSELFVGMPAWAMRQEKFVYESNRNGPPEIWLRAEGWDRSVVSPAHFPAGLTAGFMNPALSPGADRIGYARAASDGSVHAWISSVSGGSPVRLTNESKVNEYGGCWSPDAKTFAYLRETNDKIDLAVARTSGDATPVVIRHGVGPRLPEWSPDGQWISVLDRSLMLVSPDGKMVRDLGLHGANQFTFSKDSRLLYGIRRKVGRGQLFSLDIETKTEKIIGDFERELYPSSYMDPGVRLSLSPDGKSILFASVSRKSSLWMLEGFEPPTWTERLREMLPW